MRRTPALLLLLALAACSSNSPELVNDTSRPTTTVDAESEFREHIAARVQGEPPEFADTAYSLASQLCSLLDDTQTAPDGQLSQTVLDTLNAATLQPEVIDALMRTATADLCPQHTAVVAAYLDTH